ncbi:arsenate reductase ArsC [Zooshikella harenae]|uniref:Arsenate reductase ArsC n=1 Tax=Zooshikella harenae TaxID=2827238 RepID=A0ABS5ZCR3_9GAMM|nr:arsenate reductase ArsC [Zooshikella harenae]MBU2711800.1 arsenate reductase ArsC [Zooshikella harenae]
MQLLFICTHNRCRSILCEAITNHLAQGRMLAYSAGSQPVGHVHPLTLKYLHARGISIEGLQSQSWEVYETKKPEVVITVCDSAANEVCPTWFDKTVKVHWGLPDPSKLKGDEKTQSDAFFSVMNTIEQRVQKMLALDLEALSPSALQEALHAIAEEV